jgi:hypothetical protein
MHISLILQRPTTCYERELKVLIDMLSRFHKTTFANASGSGHAPLIVLIVPYCS